MGKKNENMKIKTWTGGNCKNLTASKINESVGMTTSP